MIGFASGPIRSAKFSTLKGCSLVGVFWGRFCGEEPAQHVKNIEELWALFSEGKIKPVITDIYPIERYEEAYGLMINRKARGKVVMTL